MKNDIDKPEILNGICIGPEQLLAGEVEPVIVDKTWGRELIYANDERYCAKVLHIEPGQGTSLHFHINKHETMLVINGSLLIEYIHDKKLVTKVVEPTEAFVIPPGLPHKLSSNSKDTPVTFVEASTISRDSYSIRISK